MKYLRVVEQSKVLQVLLNRPETHNAFNEQMIQEITEVFNEVPESIRVIQLRGEGKSFCAGADLEWMKSMVDYSMQENKEDSLKLFEMFSAIRNCRVPVLTVAHGNVFGGGLGLLACSDIVVAEESTKFCFSEVKLGLVPAVISPFVFDKVSEKNAKEWMLTGKVFTSMEAYFGGLVNFAASEKDINEFVDNECSRIIKSGKEAVQETKRLINQLKGWSWDERRAETTRIIAERRVSAEGQEGLKSFLEKRTPSWKGN